MERGTEVWERVVSGNLHKNPIWPMIGEREPSVVKTNLNNVAILLELIIIIFFFIFFLFLLLFFIRETRHNKHTGKRIQKKIIYKKRASIHSNKSYIISYGVKKGQPG